MSARRNLTDRETGLRFTADRDGECSECGDDIWAGYETCTDGQGGWLCRYCGIPAGCMQRHLITVTPSEGAPTVFTGTEYRHGENGSVVIFDDAQVIASFPAGEWERIAIAYPTPDDPELQPARGAGGDPCGGDAVKAPESLPARNGR